MVSESLPHPPVETPLPCWADVYLGQYWPRVASLNDHTAAWYLVAYLGLVGVNLLVDSGAQVSMLSKAQYDRLPEGSRAKLRPTQERICAANGDLISIYGRSKLHFMLDRVQYECDFLVADMGSLHGVIGMDFLSINKALIDCATGTVSLNEHRLHCKSYSPGKGGRAIVKDNVLLPARHTAVVYVEMVRWGPEVPDHQLMEPLPAVCHNENIVVPRGLISSEISDAAIQVVNPGTKDLWLTKGLVLADLEEVEVPASGKQVNAISRNGQVESANNAPLPEHLQTMVDKTNGLTEGQKDLLVEALKRFEPCFEGGKFGLGKTDMATHSIDTGNAKPFKLPPRRLGWAQKRA